MSLYFRRTRKTTLRSIPIGQQERIMRIAPRRRRREIEQLVSSHYHPPSSSLWRPSFSLWSFPHPDPFSSSSLIDYSVDTVPLSLLPPPPLVSLRLFLLNLSSTTVILVSNDAYLLTERGRGSEKGISEGIGRRGKDASPLSDFAPSFECQERTVIVICAITT